MIFFCFNHLYTHTHTHTETIKIVIQAQVLYRLQLGRGQVSRRVSQSLTERESHLVGWPFTKQTSLIRKTTGGTNNVDNGYTLFKFLHCAGSKAVVNFRN